MILKGLNYKLKTLKMIDTNAKGNKLSSKFQVNILKKNFFNIRLKTEKKMEECLICIFKLLPPTFS